MRGNLRNARALDRLEHPGPLKSEDPAAVLLLSVVAMWEAWPMWPFWRNLDFQIKHPDFSHTDE